MLTLSALRYVNSVAVSGAHVRPGVTSRATPSALTSRRPARHLRAARPGLELRLPPELRSALELAPVSDDAAAGVPAGRLDPLPGLTRSVTLPLADISEKPSGAFGVCQLPQLVLKLSQGLDVTLRCRFWPEPPKELAGVAQFLDASAQAMQRFSIERAEAAPQLASATIAPP